MGLMKVSLGNGTERTLLGDPIANALITLPNNHSYIHQGQHFKAGVSDQLAEVGDSIGIAVSTPGWRPSDNDHYDTIYHMVWRVWANSEMSFGVYEDATFTGGTEITPMNNNRTGMHEYSTDLTVVTGALTRLSGSLLLPLYYAGIVSGPGGKDVEGFSNRDDDEILLKPASTTLFQLTNLASPFSGGNVNCGIEIAWYEYVPEM